MSVVDTVILLEVGWRGYWRNRSKGGQHLSMSKKISCLIYCQFHANIAKSRISSGKESRKEWPEFIVKEGQ